MKRTLIAGLALLVLGCGSDNTVSQTPLPAPTAQPPIGRVGSYLLAANSAPTNGLVVFRVSVSGALERVASVASTAGLISLESPPASPFIYAGGFSAEVLGFRLDPATGQLAALPGFPVTSQAENNLILDQTGNFLYSLGETAIDGFRVDQTSGSLTRLPGFPIQALGELYNGDFARDNSFLYVADRGLDQLISYSLNAQTGALTEVARTPLLDPTAVEIEPSNRFVYVAQEDGNLNGYTRNANGSLTQLAGLPVRFAPPGALSARFDFHEQTLFIGDRTTRSLNAFSLNSSGQLTAVAGYPQGGGGADVVTYPLSGSFLYSADRAASLINGFSIGSASVLAPNPGSPYASGGGSNELLPVVRTF